MGKGVQIVCWLLEAQLIRNVYFILKTVLEYNNTGNHHQVTKYFGGFVAHMFSKYVTNTVCLFYVSDHDATSSTRSPTGT